MYKLFGIAIPFKNGFGYHLKLHKTLEIFDSAKTVFNWNCYITKRIALGLMAVSFLFFNTSVRAQTRLFIIEEHLDAGGHRVIEYSNGRFYKTVNGERSRLRGELRVPIPALRLPFVVGGKVYCKPSDIDGVIKDIPFNYFATLEQSAAYVNSLLKNGFRVISYMATSHVIFIKLEKNDVICRILIYDGYLKVYMPGREGFDV